MDPTSFKGTDGALGDQLSAPPFVLCPGLDASKPFFFGSVGDMRSVVRGAHAQRNTQLRQGGTHTSNCYEVASISSMTQDPGTCLVGTAQFGHGPVWKGEVHAERSDASSIFADSTEQTFARLCIIALALPTFIRMRFVGPSANSDHQFLFSASWVPSTSRNGGKSFQCRCACLRQLNGRAQTSWANTESCLLPGDPLAV